MAFRSYGPPGLADPGDDAFGGFGPPVAYGPDTTRIIGPAEVAQFTPYTDAYEAYVESQAAGGSAESVVVSSASGFSINLKYSAAALAAPQNFRDGIQAAANQLAAALTDKITVNLTINYSGTGGGASAGPSNGVYDTYTQVRSALVNNASSGDHTFDALPSGSSIQGKSLVAVWNAQQKLPSFGQLGANDTTTNDGTANFSTDINPNLLVGVALHELTHAMGRIPFGSSSGPDIFNLFRFTSPGVRYFDGHATASASYFSLDGGNTKLADYGRTSDASDFLNSGVQGSKDPFNEFYNSGTLQQLTAIDLVQLDALGFHLASATAVAGSVSINDVTVIEGNSGTKVMTFTATRTGGTAAFDINFATSNGTATVADGDYVANSGTLQFGANVNTQTISVTTNGDTKFESDETVLVTVSGATNGATISDNQGTGTITNDDAAPTNTAPVVTAHDVSIGTHGSIAASSIFVAHDQQGDNTITQYAFWDDGSSGGYFTVNGVAQGSGQWIYVSANNLGSVAYVGAPSAGTESLYVAAYDGQLWSTSAGLTARTVTTLHDFNGDGTSDILLRNDNGAIALWQMNGTQVHSDTIGNVGPDWHIEGKGDFTGEGKSDILWRQDSGLMALWQLNGAQFHGDGISSVGPDWHIAGIGDFTGDGKSDILWRQDGGIIALWKMDGTQFHGDGIGSVGPDWHIAGIGDFTGDGMSDILWRQDGGLIALWQMNGTQYHGDGVGSVGPDWHISGIGDFNGDGKSDILWRQDSGAVTTWQMNGAQFQSATVGTASSTWQVGDVGDYNGDGKSDILWRQPTGTLTMWQMDGAQIASNASVANIANDWHLV